jgi:hypothetical protein
MDGVCIDEYICWPLIHTRLANPHNSQITRAQAKSFQFASTSRFLVTDLNSEDSSAFVLTSVLSGEYPATELNF